MRTHKHLIVLVFSFCLTCLGQKVEAHPMPNSTLALRVEAKGIRLSLAMPLSELTPALGTELSENKPLTAPNKALVQSYVLAHLRIINSNNVWMPIDISQIALANTKDSIRGVYSEITVEGFIEDANAHDWPYFTIHSDIIVHQVPNHAIMVTLVQAWLPLTKPSTPQAVGLIQLNIPTGKILPLQVTFTSLQWQENAWRMLQLGIQHIAVGTDHLMFLLLLLLTAPMQQKSKRVWGIHGSTAYSIRRLLYMVTAFTLGHSLTLLTGALGWQPIASKWIEVAIALSILVSAIHAWRPIFFGKEAWIAAGFGLVHGMAFSGTLLHLQLPMWQLILSVAAFNIGIELMQLAVVLLTTPWLLMISKHNAAAYNYLKTLLACLAALAALGWIAERISNTPNVISEGNNHLVAWSPVLLAMLIVFALGIYSYKKISSAQK